MTHIQYVYPNVSEISQRGGLRERKQLATIAGCDYIEIPADFIKNKTEVDKTGLKLGDFLTEEAIAIVYKKEESRPGDIKYVLHTEPSLPRDNGYGVLHQAALNWRDKEWVESFTDMVINISRFFGIPASAIEIHPGDSRNSYADLALSIRHLLTEYNRVFNVEPLVLLENRTGHFISCGKSIAGFWEFLGDKHSDLARKIGIVLDFQQFYTVTRNEFLTQLEIMPCDALKGFHVHHKHRSPDISDEIPWRTAFAKIVDTQGNVLINPEIHHKANVEKAISFCEKMVRDASSSRRIQFKLPHW